MRVAVTGATGFLGRHLISALLDKGHQVVGWTRRPSDDAANRSPAMDSIDWVRGDLNDPSSAQRLVRGCDAVVHAALARDENSFMATPNDPVAYAQTNLIGSLALMEAAHQSDVGRFVFVSSGAVHQHVVDGIELDEQHPLRPGSMYGACKASVETMVHAYGSSGRLNAATLRPVSIYGIENPIEQSKWFDLIRSIVRGETVDVSGGGKVVHVQDVAAAILTLLQTEQNVAGETFNCCDRFVSDHQVAQITRRLTNSNAEFTGHEKSSGRNMSSAKLEALGFHFGGAKKLERFIDELTQRL